MSKFRPYLRLLAASLMGVTSAFSAPATAQTRIENVATFSFHTASGGDATVQSNAVSLDVGRIKRPTTLSFRRVGADYVFRNQTADSCQASPSPRYTPSDVTDAELQKSDLESLSIQSNYMIVLTNDGDNHDPNVRETSWITASSDSASVIFILTETGPNSGVFAGAFPDLSATYNSDAGDNPCNIHVERSKSFGLRFTEDDYSYGSTDTLLIDPQGYVFDSTTGGVMDGATVSVVNDATGQPAPVFGDDGVSTYPSTVISGSRATDSSGQVYVFNPGRFRFPLMSPGTYRLVITPPSGYKAPSTASPAQLAALTGPDGAYKIIDASYGRRFTLSTPEPLDVDVPIDPDRSGQLLLEKTASVRTASPGDTIQYDLRLTNRDTTRAVAATTISDSLPIGLHYRIGSTRGATEPQVSGDGRSLTFSLASLAAGQQVDIRYLVEVAAGAPQGEAVNRAQAATIGGASNQAIASVRIRPLLFSDALTIIGRVTEGDCADPLRGRKGVPGVRLMLEDGTLVTTDRDGLYHFEGVKAGTHVVQLDRHSIAATHEPVACDMDTRQAGSAVSRFVEAGGGSLQRVDFQLRRTSNVAALKDSLPTAAADADAAGGTQDWLKGLTPGIDWLFPAMDHNPRAPALRVVIKHLPGQRIALRINGALVDPMAFDGSDADEKAGVAISTWTGIPLAERDNSLEATVLDADGKVAATLTRTVHYATAPVHADYVPAASRLVADGLVRPLIAIRLTDRDGKPVRAGTLIGFSVDQPYMAAFDADIEAQRQLAGRERSAATARVIGDDGIAYIALQPTMEGGAVHVTALLDEKGVIKPLDFHPWLAAAAAKDWTIVGFGKGTLGYNRLRGKSTALPAGEEGGVVTDGQLKFYAKGRIKGSWLMTIAYDSKRAYDPDRGLLGTIDPDRYYTVYGDGTRQSYDASTSRKLYLRLERREFRALFGDFETGMTETHLGRYSRTLNGVKAEYHGRRLSFTGFAAHDSQLYGRDEIQGNGLSGPYRLSGVGIVPNSDKISIEVRDRIRSEKIVSTTLMTRHIDYDIDPDAGVLRFREPVMSRDSDSNPIFIVAEYETAEGRSKALVAGGRVARRFADGRVEIGASLLRDESVRTGTVAATDLKARLGKGTTLRAEAATGGRNGIHEGKAFEAEVIHQSAAVDLNVYVRQQDFDFGLGQQNAVEAGTRKIGADSRVHLTEKLSITGSAWHQDNLEDVGKRTAAQGRLEYRTRTGTLYAGAELADDTSITGESRDSRLLTLGGSQRPFGQKLELYGQTQVAMGSADKSVDFPVRQRAGLAYEVRPGFRLIAEHQNVSGTVKAHQTRVGVDVAPWTGAKLLGTVAQEAVGENGTRTYAQYGLNQSVPFGKHWTVDATVDATTTVSGTVPTSSTVNPLQPTATGSLTQGDINGDHQAFTLGATYRTALWTWNGRGEYRIGSSSNRWTITTNLLRTLGKGKTVAAGIRAYSVKDSTGAVASFLSTDVAIAYRPLDSRWAVLERLELRRERADAGVTSSNVLGVTATGNGDVSTRLINNIAISYRSGPEGDGHALEISAYHGAKYVVGSFADDAYTGFIDMVGFELRRDIGQKFDIGANISRQHSWTSHTTQFSVGPSIGFSPGHDIWLSAGYNVAGFRDRDFEDARYTRQGAYITMRLKFSQLALGKTARTLTGAER